MKKQKPWLDKNGNPFSTAQLKIQSKNWSAEDWENYLTSIESGNSDQEAVYIGKESYLEDLKSYPLADLLPNSDHLSREFLDGFREILDSLPEDEKFVIEERIYLDSTQEEIAAKMKRSRFHVRELEAIAKKRLSIDLKKLPQK